jgi:hypothetical protein
LVLASSTNELRLFEAIHFRIPHTAAYANPFDPDEVEVALEVRTPQGRLQTVPAFWHQPFKRRRSGEVDPKQDWLYPTGSAEWAVRFTPQETGEFEAVAWHRYGGKTLRSTPVRFSCQPGTSRGFVQVSRTDPRFLEFSQGAPFFPIGQNLAFIGNQQYVTLTKAEGILEQLSANGANYLRVWACCEDWAMAIEARKSAWGRSWDWHPPIVTASGPAGGDIPCLRLDPKTRRVPVNPSHRVALQPNTLYRVSASTRTEPGTSLRLKFLGGAFGPFVSSSGETWTNWQQNVKTGPDDYWLREMELVLEGEGAAWVSDLSLREGAGGPELLWEADLRRPRRGYYNPLDCFMLDELVRTAEKEGVYVQLCLLTRDLYMSALKDPASADYDQAIRDASKFFRYAIARWGYSTSVAAWEYWNEMDPNLPTDRLYSELGSFLEKHDPYRHLRTTSTWGPSRKDCQHPALDIADTHFYLRPADTNRLSDEVIAVFDRTQWLRQQAPLKPAHLGEFGLADDKWRITPAMQQRPELVDVHNALWASALSGASGTALFWWWERLDQRAVYPLYRPVSRFIADVPWNSGQVKVADLAIPDPRLRASGLMAGDQAWIWLFNRESSWEVSVIQGRKPEPVSEATVEVRGMPAGSYRVQWWDTRLGGFTREETSSVTNSALLLYPPSFSQDIAGRISHR